MLLRNTMVISSRKIIKQYIMFSMCQTQTLGSVTGRYKILSSKQNQKKKIPEALFLAEERNELIRETVEINAKA